MSLSEAQEVLERPREAGKAPPSSSETRTTLCVQRSAAHCTLDTVALPACRPRRGLYRPHARDQKPCSGRYHFISFSAPDCPQRWEG